MLDLPAHFGPEWDRKPIGDSGGIDLRQKRLVYLIVALNSWHLVVLKFRKMRPSRAIAPTSERNRLVRVLPSPPTYHPRRRLMRCWMNACARTLTASTARSP
jgi:hypothetical protein